MKRHLVMDLYHGDRKEEIGEWHDAKIKLPDEKKTKVKVKLKNGDECFAYYYVDRAVRPELYDVLPPHFWHSQSHEPLSTVKEWKALKD